MAHEYYCRYCGQLRLSFKESTKECSNCRSKDIIIGKVLELDKEELRKRFPRRPQKDERITNV